MSLVLAVTGPDLAWQKLHQRLFYLWLIVVVIHVIHYVPKLPALLAGQPAERALRVVASSQARWLLLARSLIGGLILAVLTYHLRARWGSWGGNIL